MIDKLLANLATLVLILIVIGMWWALKGRK